MNTIPFLAVLLLAPAFALLVWLGQLFRRGAAGKRMLMWSGLATVIAIAGCTLGELQPPRAGHVLWPQVAAATLAFLGFVLTWGLGFWLTRQRS